MAEEAETSFDTAVEHSADVANISADLAAYEGSFSSSAADKKLASLVEAGEDETDRDDSSEDPDVEDGLFQYSRLSGSLRRARGAPGNSAGPLASRCTCAVMGKVALTSETTAASESAGEGGAAAVEGAGSVRSATGGAPADPAIGLWQRQPVNLTACGFGDGRVLLMDSTTATSVAKPDEFVIREEERQRKPVAAVSLDASGTCLAAIDEAGMCCIWTLKYSVQMRSTASLRANSAATQNQQQGGNVFTHWIGSLRGGHHGQSRQNESGEQDTTAEEVHFVPTLTLAEAKVHRVNYPTSFGVPTCLALDPAYVQKRETALLVSFDDGRIVLSKRGWLLQRREDKFLPYAGPVGDKDFHGIEALVWRGSLMAFADCSGVRLYDTETLKPIAHVDRPSGARPSLYPTVSRIRPSLCFETSDSLLVAWGDCLMTLTIRETTTHAQPSTTPVVVGTHVTTTSPAVVRSRKVSCTMAWTLDCIVCGVAPFDESHVVVLGLVPPVDDFGEPVVDTQAVKNDVELQVVSRLTGMVVSSDLLPLVRPPEPTGRFKSNTADSTIHMLLSSFAVPRMDNTAELREQGSAMNEPSDMLNTSIFASSPESKSGEFKDLHLKWNMDMILFEKNSRFENDEQQGVLTETSTGSVDSDDYGFVFRPSAPDVPDTNETPVVPPPLMVVASGSDMVLVRVRDVDDAVSFALEKKKPARALNLAMHHSRQLRRHKINDLVNEYFRSVLRLPGDDDEPSIMKPEHLSLRRVQLACEAMPILLGVNVEMWELWVQELEKIPGALFVVRNILPVRDPKLPKRLFARVLWKMLQQIEAMKDSSKSDVAERLATEAEGHFLNTLIAWGTTSALREHIKLYEYQTKLDPNFGTMVRIAQENLNRRYEQTAAGYLDFHNAHRSSSEDRGSRISGRRHSRDTRDALYDQDDLIAILARRLSVLQVSSSSDSLPKEVKSELLDSKVALDALARVNMMKGRFNDALSCFLTLSVLHSPRTLEDMEEAALSLINSQNSDSSLQRHDQKIPYAFVVRFIEDYHLHQCLLDAKFLPEAVQTPPLFGLIRLVGLQLAGDFLIEHCVAPEQTREEPTSLVFAPGSRSDKTIGERRGTLPLDLVADQLSGSPKLFHWYLHLVFTRKPEVYVKFPNTANPPAVITTLHKRHLDLYIKYAGDNRDSAKALQCVESYRVAEKATPFLSFLKVILQLGAVGPLEVGKMLQKERRGGAGVSHTFALELAYIMEHYGDDSESDARLVLELYLKGAQSLMLAVAFAQRAGEHSSVLWETLIDYCLSGSKSGSAGSQFDGSLFGSLLEAAALSGADLAKLVKQIPTGMVVEGLRPRLVAAVADYRMKVQMQQNASEIALKEKVALHRELTQRSRRGVRCKIFSAPAKRGPFDTKENSAASREKDEEMTILPPELRPRNRQDRHSLSFTLPVR